MRGGGVNDRGHERVAQVGRGCEALAAVVARLLHEASVLHQLRPNHVADVADLVGLGDALEELLHPLDDLGEKRLLLFLHLARAARGHRLLGLVAPEAEPRLALRGEPVVREHDLREVDALALAPELKQRHEAAVEDRPLLDLGAAVVEDLRQEGIGAQVRVHVGAEEDERLHRLGRRLRVVLAPGNLGVGALCLRGRELAHQAVGDRLHRLQQVALARLRVELDHDHPLDLVIVVVPGAVELRLQVEDHVRVGEGFGRRHVAALRGIADRIGVDYVVIDAAETCDGRLMVFEADIAMIVHDLDPPHVYPYKSPHMATVFAAFRDMIRRAAADLGRAPRPDACHGSARS